MVRRKNFACRAAQKNRKIRVCIFSYVDTNLYNAMYFPLPDIPGSGASAMPSQNDKFLHERGMHPVSSLLKFTSPLPKKPKWNETVTTKRQPTLMKP